MLDFLHSEKIFHYIVDNIHDPVLVLNNENVRIYDPLHIKRHMVRQ